MCWVSVCVFFLRITRAGVFEVSILIVIILLVVIIIINYVWGMENYINVHLLNTY